jgi:hypothetical protein
MLYLDSAKELSMNDEELREVTRKIADMLFGCIVKIFGLAFLLEVTRPTIAELQLVFRPLVTDTDWESGR